MRYFQHLALSLAFGVSTRLLSPVAVSAAANPPTLPKSVETETQQTAQDSNGENINNVPHIKVETPSSDGKDKYDTCVEWAEKGECEANAEYMKMACPASCEKFQADKQAILQELEGIKSIHQLSAKDIHGNVVEFHDYEGYVLVFVNVIAVDNIMSDAHYKGLLELAERVKGQKVEFLLFPTEQFVHEQDKENMPADMDDVLAYFTNKGFMDDENTFIIMEPIKVNGPDAHLVYKFAKYDAVPSTPGIAWNFDPYFIAHPSGELEARHRVHPHQLFEPIMEHFGTDEL